MAILTPTTIDEYITGYPENIQVILNKFRSTVQKAAPGAQEKIGYGVPTFVSEGKNLVHFAAFKNHIGFYPAPSAIKVFAKELSNYDGAKGSIKFPIEKPLPWNLITKIVKFRAKENLETKKKSSAKK